MVFSITAPFISDEADRKAKESLSESERQQIHNDLFGIPNKCIATATNGDSTCTSPRTSSLDFFIQEGDGKIEDGNNIHQRLSNSLDASVKQSIGSDGCDCSNESLRRQLGHKLIRESLDQLPIELNDAYRVAVEKNPTLFNSSECNWDYYIYQYNTDVWAAAEGIARYWTLRRTAFGAERYYKNMAFEREGCMYDIKNEFSYGGVRIDGYDNHGRPILFAERETMTSMHRDIAVQLLFFWIHQLIYNRHQIPYVYTQRNNLTLVSETRSSNPFADGVNPYDDNSDDAAVAAGPRIISCLPSHQDFSYVMVVNLKGFELSKDFDRKRSKRVAEVLELLPQRATHICIGSGTRSVFGLLLPFYKALFPERSRVRTFLGLVLHNGSNAELLDRLQVYGIPKSCLDVAIGGLLTKNDFVQTFLLHQRQQDVDQSENE